MERIKHKLGDQRQPDDLNQQRALMLCLADVHSYFWGGASGRHPKGEREEEKRVRGGKLRMGGALTISPSRHLVT